MRILLPLLLSALLLPAQTRLRILTYNIHHGEGTDGKIDLERIAAVIRAAEPDFAAIQEVDVRTERSGGIDQAHELARLTGLHAIFGKTIPYRGGLYGNVLLSKWPLNAFENHELPFTPGREKRAVIEARSATLPLRVFATHLDITEADRTAAAKFMTRFGGDDPAILAGDLNAVPDSEPMRILLEKWTNPSPEPLPTVPVGTPRRQIDYVLFRPASRWKVIEVHVRNEPTASDHRPLLAVLELQEP